MSFELDGRFEPVGTANTAPAAIELACNGRPDAVVLDISIGGSDGLSLLPALRAELPRARIVVFTGHDEQWLRDRAAQEGAAAWVVKGGDLSRLLDEIAKGALERDEAVVDAG
jgi:DNA-binding NarL/FixJ family response regulator